MKRFHDGNAGGQFNKRSRGPVEDGACEVRILIPSKVAGSIIGKGGANISRLRNDFQASVTVPDCPGPERVLTVAAEKDAAMKVLNEVVPGLAEYQESRGRPRGAPTAPSGNGAPQNDGGVDLRLLVHQSHAGCIIGKGGGKVKELREKTGARIKIYTNCCPQSTDRVVQLTGKAETTVECVREILELLETQGSVKGVDNPYDPMNYDDFYADEYGGFGGGGGNGYGPSGPPAMGRNGPMGGATAGRYPAGPRDIAPRGMGGRAGGFGGAAAYSDFAGWGNNWESGRAYPKN